MEERLELLADDAVQERLHRIVRLVSALGILRIRHLAEVIGAEVMSQLGVDVDPGPLALRVSPSQSPSRLREPSASGCAPNGLGRDDPPLFATWAPANAKIPRDHRVFERDGWRCTVPGCTSYRNLHSHQIVFRSDQGREGIGRIRIRGRAPDALCFEMPLATYGPSERILR